LARNELQCISKIDDFDDISVSASTDNVLRLKEKNFKKFSFVFQILKMVQCHTLDLGEQCF
jgi:hypothetical protein